MNETEQATHTPAFRFRVDERSPGHTTFTVFVGQEGQGGNAGRLTLRNEEYDALAPLLLAAPGLLAALERTFGLVENGILVRNMEDDGDLSQFIHQGAELVTALAEARAAIQKARS